MPNTKRILLVEDEEASRYAVTYFLRSHGFEVAEAGSCSGALEKLRHVIPDVVIIDNFLPDGTALDLLPKLKSIDRSMAVILLTGFATIDLAVAATRHGVEQFLQKPVELPSLLVIIESLVDLRRRRRRELAERPRSNKPDPFIGSSVAIRRLQEQAQRVALSDSAVVIQGETGSGKGVLAHWLHRNSPRCDEPFVDLNCAGLSRELLDSELFGHTRGAFTSAVDAKQGLVEIADRGTLFLDEIGDIDAQVQPKLLKVLEEHHYRRLGETKDRSVDLRLIAASHHELPVLVQQGRFRSDLYFRISAVPLRVPPLRERAEDIPALANSVFERLTSRAGRTSLRLSDAAIGGLQRYHWPGNVRELRNVLERALLFTQSDVVTPSDLIFDARSQVAAVEGSATQAQASSLRTDMTLEELERTYIEHVLAEEEFRIMSAAARLNIPRSSLYQKIKQLGITLKRPPSGSEDLPDPSTAIQAYSKS